MEVLDSLPFYVMLVDSGHHILFANKSVRSQLDVEPRDIVGKYCPRAVHGLDHPFPGCPLETAVAKGGIAVEHEQFDENSGRWFLLSVYPTGCKSSDGEDIYFHIVQDVSEKKEAQRAQWESEDRYRQIIDTTKDIVCVGDPEGRIIDINPAGLQLLGYSSVDELRGMNYITDLYFNPDDHEDFMRLISERGFVEDCEIDLRNRAGDKITVTTCVTAVRDDEGSIVELRAIMRDITENKMLQQQLYHAQRMEAIGRFAGGIAHDFNNFLMAIRGHALLLLKDLPEGDPSREDLNEILRTTERGADLTRQLLLFGRSTEPDLKPVDLDDMIDGTRALLEQLIGENYTIATRNDGGSHTVRADPVQLQQVLMNLVINARDAMPGGGTITIGCSAIDVDEATLAENPKAAPGRAACITVADEGAGIPEDHLGKIFDPFFTTKKAGKGTGLGLSVVHGIVTRHGGWMDVESSPEKGTSFSFCLPLSREAALEGITDVDTDDEVVAGNGQLILVVEDEESIQKIVARMLTRQGFSVTVAGSAEEALELVRDGEAGFDLLFTDVMLPGESGIALAARLREQHPGLKVLLTSGYADDGFETGDGDRADFQILQKPYTITTLARAVNRALAGG